MTDGDGGWVDVSDAKARTRRSGATATLWRDTVIFIGGRNRNADGCGAAAGDARLAPGMARGAPPFP